MRIHILVGDSGDGSSHLRFLDSEDAVDFLIETDPDTYSDGDGGSSYCIEIKAVGFTEDEQPPLDVTGIYGGIETLAQVKAALDE